MNEPRDIFEEYLNKKGVSEWATLALRDKSYKVIKKEEERFKELQELKNNQNLAILGDALIKVAYSEILFYEEKLTEEKQKYESDKTLVEKVAKHYNMLKYIDKDENDPKLSKTYEYRCSGSKYIATAVEAMVGAIYKEERNLPCLIRLLSSWMKL